MGDLSSTNLVVLLAAMLVGTVVSVGLYKLFKKITHIILHGILGIVILFIVNSFGLGIPYSLPVILVSLIGGATGALFLIILHLGKII